MKPVSKSTLRRRQRLAGSVRPAVVRPWAGWSSDSLMSRGGLSA
jgi:hypothetical protein